MDKEVSPIIHAKELSALYQLENFILIDASTGNNAKANYEANHLDRALFIDLNTQLSARNESPENGGRHPLPDPEKFVKNLEALGIGRLSHVVIYDDKNGANAAARLWWMLKSIGLNKVQVLNGGIQEAIKVGYNTNSDIVIPYALKSSDYRISNWTLPLADIVEVENVSQNKDYLVIDVREAIRYRGEQELIDAVAGHIPGAKNVPFAMNLDNNGLFLTPDKLRSMYQEIFGSVKSENVIVHCGSGVTACHTLLSIVYSGLEIPKLYVGSWSEWSKRKLK